MNSSLEISRYRLSRVAPAEEVETLPASANVTASVSASVSVSCLILGGKAFARELAREILWLHRECIGKVIVLYDATDDTEKKLAATRDAWAETQQYQMRIPFEYRPLTAAEVGVESAEAAAPGTRIAVILDHIPMVTPLILQKVSALRGRCTGGVTLICATDYISLSTTPSPASAKSALQRAARPDECIDVVFLFNNGGHLRDVWSDLCGVVGGYTLFASIHRDCARRPTEIMVVDLRCAADDERSAYGAPHANGVAHSLTNTYARAERCVGWIEWAAPRHPVDITSAVTLSVELHPTQNADVVASPALVKVIAEPKAAATDAITVNASDTACAIL